MPKSAKNVRWDLSDLFSGPSDPTIQKSLETSLTKAKQLAKKYKGKIATLSSKELLSVFKALEATLVPLYKASQYSHLLHSVDTGNDEVKKLVASVEEIGSSISNELVFFRLELGALPELVYKAHLKSPELADFYYNIALSKKTAQYNLSEKEEKVLNLKELTGPNAFKKMYSELTSSFQFEMILDGKKITLSGSELRALRQHADPKIRREAMEKFFTRYAENKIITTQVFNSVLKDYTIERNLRGYKSAISVMNVGNDLDDKAIEALHTVTNDSYTLVQRYYKLKKKILKLPELTLADIYAPMPQSDKKYRFEEAKKIVLDGFKEFDKEFYSMAKLMFNQNRIDAPVTKGKRGGAYCSSSTPDIKPYVFLNFLGKQRDVSTMAHELGHAIHAMLCERLPLANAHAILPLCETASVFSEMIITDKLLKTTTRKLDKQALLTDKLEDIFATSHRQNMFSNFEQDVHQKLEKSLLSSDDYCDIYQKHLTQMFGKSVTYTPEYRWEWSSIPHMIEVPFYVYSYNFGNLLVMALYQQFKSEGASFIPKLKKMLAMGSSASPNDICKIVGADIAKPAFWQKSIDYIDGLIEQLEAL